MMLYSGKFDSEKRFQVWKDGKILSPARSLKIRNHSPDGFSWGYQGSGPAQLALAILLEETTEEKAEEFYQFFKSKVIASLSDDWSFSSELVQKFLENSRT